MGGLRLIEFTVMNYEAYLASEDNNFVDSSCSLILQELTHDKATYSTGSGDGKVLETRHALLRSV
jgi:hypothetical protein